jgi:hypothetical protein
MPLIALAIIALLAPGPAPAATGAWILHCQIGEAPDGQGSQGGQGEVRTFRVAPKVLQEWRPADRRFGPNLCETFACKVDRARLEGVISSASLILTLRVDRDTGQGSWSTVGASGLKQTRGACRVEPEKAGPKSG